MLKAAVLLIMALAVNVAQAEICPTLDFAEMDAMSADELLALRCEYNTTWLDLTKDLNKGSVAQGQRLFAIVVHCSDQVTRMDRILGRKYGFKGTADDVTREMSRRCKG